jgi:hypothetical protein
VRKLFFILPVTLLLAFGSFAQQTKQYAEVGLFAGGSFYIGDLNAIPFKFTQPAAGVVFRYNFNPRLAVRFSGLYGNIKADDALSASIAAQQRNLNFKSRIIEVSGQLEFNFLDFKIGEEQTILSPYIFLGIGGFRFKPKANLGYTWADLQPLGTEGQGLAGGAEKKKYKLTQACIPFGIGAKINLTKVIGISFEWGMRKTFTDYLDDVSKTYYDPVALATARGGLAASASDPSIGTDSGYSNTGRQRGNPTTKDWYSFAGITLTVKLTGKLDPCPKVN